MTQAISEGKTPSTIPLTNGTPTPAAAEPPPAAKPMAVAVEALPPLLVTAENAARLCAISRPSWDRYVSSGKTPAPRRIGGRPLWSVEELRSWIDSGCPARREWEARREAEKRSSRRS
jgi:predicted DNA-binding transcriptional regulator AlpA